jgi:hypothetical protein
MILAKKKEVEYIFLGFKDPETGKFEPLPSPSEVKRLLIIMGEVIGGRPQKSVG